jgi:hypothetical protein
VYEREREVGRHRTLGIIKQFFDPAKMVRGDDAGEGVGLGGVLGVEFFVSAKCAVRRAAPSG